MWPLIYAAIGSQLDGILKDNLPEDMHDSLPAEQCGTYDMLEDPFSAPKDYVFRLDGARPPPLLRYTVLAHTSAAVRTA